MTDSMPEIESTDSIDLAGMSSEKTEPMYKLGIILGELSSLFMSYDETIADTQKLITITEKVKYIGLTESQLKALQQGEMDTVKRFMKEQTGMTFEDYDKRMAEDPEFAATFPEELKAMPEAPCPTEYVNAVPEEFKDHQTH